MFIEFIFTLHSSRILFTDHFSFNNKTNILLLILIYNQQFKLINDLFVFRFSLFRSTVHVSFCIFVIHVYIYGKLIRFERQLIKYRSKKEHLRF